MTVLTFNGKEWTRKPKGRGQVLDNKVVFRNETAESCNIKFDPLATFGIDSTNLAAGSEIRFSLGQHPLTKCTAFVGLVSPECSGVTETI
jgi:hypothetical protein